jgi:hypothetical protein
MTIEDMVGELGVAYTKCLAGFNPDVGIRFSTYLVTACYRHANQMIERLERERQVVSCTSIDSLMEDGEGSEFLDRYIASEEHISHEDVLLARERMIDLARSMTPNARKVCALLVRPTPELIAFCEAKDPPKDGRDPVRVDLICRFLGLDFKAATALRFEFRHLADAEFTRITRRSYAV